MSQSKLKQLLESTIRRVVVEEIQKSQNQLRKEFYSVISEMKNSPNKPAIKSKTREPNSIMDILESVSPFSSSEYDQTSHFEPGFLDSPVPNNALIEVPKETVLKKPIKAVVDVLNNTDFAAKARAMEEAAKKRREMM